MFSDVTYLAGTLPGSPTPVSFTAARTRHRSGEITFALCFCQGTLIRTPWGEVPVENLPSAMRP